MKQFRHMAIMLAGMVALGGVPALADSAMPEPVAETADDLIAAGLADEAGLAFVEDLTTEIGARLAGSADEARARDWAVAELQALGFDRVRVEDFTIPYWARTHESARVVGANTQNLVISALGGSQPTPEGGLEGDLVRFESLAGLMAAAPGEVDGKIVFIDEKMYKTQDGSGYGLAVRKRGGCAVNTAVAQ